MFQHTNARVVHQRCNANHQQDTSPFAQEGNDSGKSVANDVGAAAMTKNVDF